VVRFGTFALRNKINQFNFDTRKCRPVPAYGMMHNSKDSAEENKRVMLGGLQNFCMNCRLCSIGCKLIKDQNEFECDPHVMSNMMFNAKFMIIGQNPGLKECKVGIPFIGKTGKILDEELKKNTSDRSKFYISNIIKCPTKDNDCKKICSSIFLTTEIKIIQPKLIIAIGKLVFDFFCPEEKYQSGKITKSKFGKIYAVDDPTNSSHRKNFNRQIELLTKLVKKTN